MKDVRQALRAKRLYFDGGYGTALAAATGENCAPELLNLKDPAAVTALHRAYLAAGANILTTNTFGVNRDKYENYETLIAAAVHAAREAANSFPAHESYIAFDMGPTGRMLEPLGDLSFEDAVALYGANVRAAVRAGVDLILIETMSDAYETKAAVLAAKENADLPIFVTNAYDKSGKLMTGADPRAMIALLEGLRVDAIGMNCSFGPDAMLSLVDLFLSHSSLPVIANPNAGLPRVENGETVYDISPERFADYMCELAQKGVGILGGCCGTTPAYIEATVRATREIPFTPAREKGITLVSSYTHAVSASDAPLLIGERINPTGKPKLKEALRAGDMNYILNEGIRESDAGVHILDVNVGLPEIDEVAMLSRAVKELQAVTDLPLQLDSADPAALAAAMRVYNGKPLVNSVNGKAAVMDAVFPLVAKYGGAVIALTIDGDGIPDTAAGRVAIAERIAAHAATYGIAKKDIIVDPLCLAVSSDKTGALVTLESVRLLRAAGFLTSLGVSNISFGLPEREKINAAFFAAALENGLDLAIMNPFSLPMTDTYFAHRVLHAKDPACADYIAYATAEGKAQTATPARAGAMTLGDAIERGLKENAETAASELLATEDPLAVIERQVIPALGAVGERFEQKRIYLPQLLMSAEAACAALDRIKAVIPRESAHTAGAVILATVMGDIHDIGKNIVKVLLESHGFEVYDLGRDVPPEKVLAAVRETGCRLVGLSALMTTTVPAMEKTIALLHAEAPGVKVMVGGAVLNPEYAAAIGADLYGADAMAAVHHARTFYEKA